VADGHRSAVRSLLVARAERGKVDTGFPPASRSELLESITSHDLGSSRSKIIVIWKKKKEKKEQKKLFGLQGRRHGRGLGLGGRCPLRPGFLGFLGLATASKLALCHGTPPDIGSIARSCDPRSFN
jgi:hypothetical protein